MGRSRSSTAVRTIMRLVGDAVRFVSEAGAVACPTRRREPVLAEATRAVHGAAGEATPCRQRDSAHARRAVVPDRVASCPDSRETRHVDPLASEGLSSCFGGGNPGRLADREWLSITHRPFEPEQQADH